jgi:alcohol dehydrogenase class IV
VGFGGGSSMDVAKLAALLLGSGEELDGAWGVGQAAGPRLPLVLVPTTAGTGSEVTPVAIVTVDADEKRGVSSPVILPDMAVLDAELTIGLPAAITAATGIDAMVHAIEAFTSRSPNANPLSRMLAKEALRLLGAHVARAVKDGSDLEARRAMLMGSMLAGQAFANAPVAAVHALAYPIGGIFHVPHGLSNALVLPHVLRFNAREAGAEYGALSELAFPDHIIAPDLADGLAKLSAQLGLPGRLRDVGVGEDDLARCARDAMKQTRLLVNNPRIITESDALAIYEAAW